MMKMRFLNGNGSKLKVKRKESLGFLKESFFCVFMAENFFFMFLYFYWFLLLDVVVLLK